MKTLHIPDQPYYNVCYNSEINKIQIIKTDTNIFESVYL